MATGHSIAHSPSTPAFAGALLLGHLIDKARANGYTTMYSIDSAANTAMHELARELGFSTSRDPDDSSQVIHRLSWA